jgi:hypothetical protein
MVWREIASRALGAVERAGERRISTKRLVEEVRARLKVKVNNSWTSFIADELVQRYPPLDAVIERRARKSGERVYIVGGMVQ